MKCEEEKKKASANNQKGKEMFRLLFFLPMVCHDAPLLVFKKKDEDRDGVPGKNWKTLTQCCLGEVI